MRKLIALTLVVLSTAAGAEEWVAVRTPSDPGQAGLPSISVDTTSIEILNTGIRRARVKTDFLANGRKSGSLGPTVITMIIWVNSYDCARQMRRNDSLETHLNNGTVTVRDLSMKWYPAPENRWADPTLDFICRWQDR
jgi:hypothetical protein